jgi:hypothetical protein
MRRFLFLWPCLLLLLAACSRSAPASTPATGNTDGTVKTVFSDSGASAAVKLQNVSYITDAQGEIFYIGEVLNTSKSPVTNAKVTLQFVDAAGAQLAQASFLNPGLQLLQPGEKTAWKLFIGKLPGTWAATRATVVLDAADGDQETYVPLKTEGVALAPPGKESWVTGNGRVLNPTSDPMQGVLLIVGLYDGNGKLLDVTYGVPQDKQLIGKGATSFSIEFRNTKQVPTSYKVFAMGTK